MHERSHSHHRHSSRCKTRLDCRSLPRLDYCNSLTCLLQAGASLACATCQLPLALQSKVNRFVVIGSSRHYILNRSVCLCLLLLHHAGQLKATLQRCLWIITHRLVFRFFSTLQSDREINYFHLSDNSKRLTSLTAYYYCQLSPTGKLARL